MKTKARILLTLIPLALLAALVVPSRALAQVGTYVFDEQDVLSPTEFSALESTAASYADEYHVGVYLLFCDNLGSDQGSGSGRREFARDYFNAHDLGVGSGRNGIILTVGVGSRKYVTVKHFDNSAEDPFSDDSVNAMEDDVVDCLKDDEWYEAADSYYSVIGEHLAYFAKNGKQWQKPHLIGTIVKVAATVLLPLFIALAVVTSERNAMKTARMQTEASAYLEPDTFHLTLSTDTFVNRTMSVTPIPRDDDDDGGGWSDMGGGFSGSDGGSF